MSASPPSPRHDVPAPENGTEIAGLWRKVDEMLVALRGREGASRVELENQLAESLHRIKRSHHELTDYVENSNIGLHWVGPTGVILWANQAELNLLGYTREEYVGQPITHFHADPPVIQNILERLARSEPLHNVPARLQAKDGSIKHVLISSSLLVEGGQPIHTRCFTVDVTESKRLEEEKALLLSALDSAIEGVALLKADHFIYLNRAQAQMFGYTKPEELLGRSWRDLYSPDEQARIELHAFAALRSEGFWRGTTLGQRRDGSSFVKNLSLQALPNGHLISIGSDITGLYEARQRLESANAELSTTSEQLRQANVELEAAARVKDEFMANMSHELRTPLTAMLGMTDVLREQIHGPLSPRQMRSIEIISQSSQHLLGLINDILDLAKIEARMLQLNRESISADATCQAAMQIVLPLAQAKGVELAFQLDPGVSTLQADARRLRQILLNLLSNAVKFTPPKGKVSLVVSPDDAGQTVRFSVSDTGIGISTAELQELCQPFKQLHGDLARNYEGTGLGLVLARRLTELHGGRLTIESTVGQGSCFSVFLPRGGAPPNQPTNPADGHRTALPQTQQHRQLRVLVVDDNEANLEAHADYLTAKHWKVVAVQSGLEAVSRVETDEFDLVLMDIQMPGMDGLKSIRQIRNLPHGRSLPIIALTALAMSEDREKCLLAGADHYLSKPVGLGKLNEEMHQLLAKLNR